VNVTFDGGRVHALLGKNGAGKSTLIKIFAGAIQPTSGKLLVGGREVHLDSPADAFKQGIATVHQELSLIPNLTVAENILLGRLPRKRTMGVWRIDWAETFLQGQALLDEMQAGIDARQRARELGVAQQQVVEIAKAMSFRPRALLLDEPTSALSQHEMDRLFILLRRLASSGVAPPPGTSPHC
jgi:ribose transport system ATP-binding protein